MSFELIAIDLDGTLLGPDNEISAATAGMLHLARQRLGVRVVLATARPPRSTMRYYRQLGLDTPIINYNGALVFDPPTGDVLLHTPIGPKLTRKIIDVAREAFPEVRVSAEVLDRWYTDQADQPYVTQTGLTFDPDVVGPIDEWLTQSVTKLLLLGPVEMMDALGQVLINRFTHQVMVMQTDGELLQIMHPTVSKMKALRTVAGELRIARERVMAIGDNANDAEMLRWAGMGVAMGNAVDDVLASANYVTEPHDADGVAHAIHRLIFHGRPLEAILMEDD
jgi:Cof subfamily protein (haloacid dehalogenase superfamily)